MKKTAIICLAICLCLCGCSPSLSDTEKSEEPSQLIGLWITYSELSDFSKSNQGFEKSFTAAVQKAKDVGINTLFVHVRAFCDAVYQSEFFPFATYLEPCDYDILQKMIEISHANGMQFHAWLNPYRVSTATTDINALPQESPVKQWLCDDIAENDKNVCITEDGIYLNPAESEVKRLVLSGVREILQNYAVDGIHIDDYFYPTTAAEFDELSYRLYSEAATEPLELDEWRRKNVSSLINAIYCAVKSGDESRVFGVSPAADLSRCYNELYADIEGWIGAGFIDYIMPQLYFGFEYPTEQFRFDNLLVKWMDLTMGKDVKLYCGLASYKIGTKSEPDNIEWNKYDDIIARQIDLINENKLPGYVFFSYTSLFSSDELNVKQLDNIKKE